MTRPLLKRWMSATLCAYAALCFSSRAYADVTIVVDNLDAAGEGFNDPTPFSPMSGNPATTVGQARLNAFQYAATLWGQNLKPGSSAQPGLIVHVGANFDPLPCTTTSGILGQAGAQTLHSDFPNAPLAGIWYPQALANSIAGVDLDPTTSDISATFNSDVDNPTCLGATRWYYGLDAKPGPGNIDLVTVVLHELAHGLGFQPFLDETTGVRPLNINDAFLVLLEQHNGSPSRFADMTTDAQRKAAMVSGDNLHWLGSYTDASASALLTSGIASGHVQMYAPAPVQPGSSVAHFSDILTPNQLMEPSYVGPTHDVLLASEVLRDIGWRTTRSVPLSSPWMLWFASASLLLLGARTRKRTA